MRFSSTFLVLLASISQAMGMVAFGTPSYAGGVVTLTTTTWTDAPQFFNLALVSPDGTVTTIEQNVSTTPGTWHVYLPSSLPPGSYRLQAQSADGHSVYTTTSAFTVPAGSIPSSVPDASVSVGPTGTVNSLFTATTVTGSSTTFVSSVLLTGAAEVSSISVVKTSGVTTITSTTTSTPSPIATTVAFVTDTVFTSGSITTTIPITSNLATSVHPSPATIVQTATTTSKKSAGLKAAGLSAGLPIVALALGALLL